MEDCPGANGTQMIAYIMDCPPFRQEMPLSTERVAKSCQRLLTHQSADRREKALEAAQCRGATLGDGGEQQI